MLIPPDAASARYTESSSVDNAAGAQFVNRNCVAALAVLVYDILLTTDEEVQLIWPKRLSYTKLLYFFIRYFPVLVLVSILFVGTELTPQFHFTPHDCFIWQVWQGVAALLVAAAVDIVLVLRVYAMYAQSRNVLVVLGVAFVLEIACMVASLCLALPGIRYDDICTVTAVPTSILIYGAASLLFQLTLFVLTTVKFVTSLRRSWGRTPLITLLARDGTWAFALVFLILCMQASLYALPEDMHGYIGMFYGWLLVVFSFCGYRILLNIQHLSPSLGDGYARRGPARASSSSGRRRQSTTFAFTTHMEYEEAPIATATDAAVEDISVWAGEEYEMAAPGTSRKDVARVQHDMVP